MLKTQNDQMVRKRISKATEKYQRRHKSQKVRQSKKKVKARKRTVLRTYEGGTIHITLIDITVTTKCHN